MGKSQKLHRLLRKIFNKSGPDELPSSSGSSRWVSFSSSSGSSRVSSPRSTRDSSRRLSMISTSESGNSSGTFDTDCDCEDDDCWSSPPQGVPAGCLPVYVGEERRRFIIPTSYLTNSTFRELLAKSEEEYGLRCEGGCESHALPSLLSIYCGRCKALRHSSRVNLSALSQTARDRSLLSQLIY